MKRELERAKEVLDNHGVIAFPTETVMGLAVYYDDYDAYLKLNNIKRRPEDKPYTMMVKSLKEIEKYAYVDERTQKIMASFMPGPLTILLPAKDSVPTWVTHNSGIIGIRIPSNEIGLALLNALDKPILVPSANRSGENPALNSGETKKIFGDEVDFIIEGEANLDKPSTIIDLTGEEIKIVRPGPISIEEINEVLKR